MVLHLTIIVMIILEITIMIIAEKIITIVMEIIIIQEIHHLMDHQIHIIQVIIGHKDGDQKLMEVGLEIIILVIFMMGILVIMLEILKIGYN